MEEQTDVDKPTDDDMEVVSSEVKGLQEELSETREKLTIAQKELATSEEARENAEKCNEELQEKVDTLSQELHGLRGGLKKTSVKDAACQMDPIIDVTVEVASVGDGPSDWVIEEGTAGTSAQSVADSVKAAAEAAVNRSGFVLDPTSGMYYDCSSGYYYDQVNKLYYDPNSGTYYYFDERTSSYQFHSQIELPASHQARQGHRGKGRGRGVSEKRKEKRRAEETRVDNSRRADTNLYDEECEIIEMEQDTRHRQKRRRNDALQDVSRNLLERESSARSRRDRREHRLRKEHHSRSRGEVGAEVEVVTSRHDRSRRKHSREQRRKHRLETHSRREKKSGETRRRNKKDDHSYHSRQEQQEMMEVISDGELEMDEEAAEQVEGRKRERCEREEENGHQSKDEKASNDRRSNETKELQTTSHEADGEDRQKTRQTSPEAGRGSSEGSTTKDDSQSGEEARGDEGKIQQARGQVSSEQEDDGNCSILLPNPVTEMRGMEPRPNASREDRNNGKETQEISETEIVQDVMIIEDGEELIVLSSDEMEEGELSDSMSFVSSSEGSYFESESEISEEEELEEISLDSDNSAGIEVLKVDYPPCIRMIVTKSDTIKPLGSLFIVTCSGGTIGREGGCHVLLIPSVKVSKRHAQIVYDSEERQYTIIDLGSQNGTLINGKAISEQRVVSEPHPLSHRDYVTIGGTTVRLHIHTGDETCEECEPGQVQALMAMQQQNEPGHASSSTKQDKEQQRKKELRQLKKKFNLSKEDFVSKDPALMNSAYADRAGERRRTVGSDNPYQPDDAPASVDRAISSTNLGHKLLSKMGWTEGQSLGKSDQGIKEPIKAVVHTKNAGLGAGIVQSIDQVQFARRRNDRWNRARGRFNNINPPPLGAFSRGKRSQAWVQGGAEQIQTSRQEEMVGNRPDATYVGVVQLPLAAQREIRQSKPQEIVEIWDESMETSLNQNKDGVDSGRTHSKESTKETDKGDDGSWAGKHGEEKAKFDHTDGYERLLLRTVEKNSVDSSVSFSQTPQSSSTTETFVKRGKPGKGGNRQLRKRTEDKCAEDSQNVSDEQSTEAGDGATDCNQEIEERNSKLDDKSMKILKSSSNLNESSESILQASSSVETAIDNEQSKSLPDTSDAKEILGQVTNPGEKTSEISEKAAFQLNSETAGSSNDKGKVIKLKWNKGGKEKLTPNLLAFEESDSEKEEEEEEEEMQGESSKNVHQQKVKSKGVKSPQEKADNCRTRPRSDRLSRWSKTRSSSGK